MRGTGFASKARTYPTQLSLKPFPEAGINDLRVMPNAVSSIPGIQSVSRKPYVDDGRYVSEISCSAEQGGMPHVDRSDIACTGCGRAVRTSSGTVGSKRTSE